MTLLPVLTGWLALGVLGVGWFLLRALAFVERPSEHLCSECRRDHDAYTDMFNTIPAPAAGGVGVLIVALLSPIGVLFFLGLPRLYHCAAKKNP